MNKTQFEKHAANLFKLKDIMNLEEDHFYNILLELTFYDEYPLYKQLLADYGFEQALWGEE